MGQLEDLSNEQFRHARRQQPSRRAPGECLSRQELAELVNAWIYTETGKRVELDANYIGKLERGTIRWPSRLYRQAFRVIFQVEADSQLGFFAQRRRSVSEGDMDRQQFLRLGGSVMILPLSELFAPGAMTSVPTKVGQAVIDQVRAVNTFFTSWDNAQGGGVARDAAFAQLRWAARLLNANCPEPLRGALFTAVGELANTTGFMCFDAYAHDEARRAFRFALACAEQADDWQLRASVLTDMARQASWCRNPDEALTLADNGLVRADRLTATERAALHSQRARALGKMGQVQEALGAVGAADDAFSHAKPADDPSWMRYYSEAQHQGDTAQTLIDLTMAGVRTQAEQRMAYATKHHGEAYVRSRAISLIRLASLYTATGDPRQGAVMGNQALDSVVGLRSNRINDDLRELRFIAKRHERVAEVSALRDRISVTVAA